MQTGANKPTASERKKFLFLAFAFGHIVYTYSNNSFLCLLFNFIL